MQTVVEPSHFQGGTKGRAHAAWDAVWRLATQSLEPNHAPEIAQAWRRARGLAGSTPTVVEPYSIIHTKADSYGTPPCLV